MAESRRRTLKLKNEELDIGLLPADARAPGTAAHRNAASQFLRKQLRVVDGVIESLTFGPEGIEIVWAAAPDSPGPLGPIVKMLKEGRYREAVLLLRLFLSDDPKNGDLLYNLGVALSDSGQIDEAVAVLRRLLAVEPEHTNGRVALGVALTRIGDNAAAVEELARAAAEAPDNPWAQRNLGGALLKLGRFAEAATPLREAAELSPDDERAWYGLGQALELSGDMPGADAAYQKVLALDEYGEAARLAREARGRLAQKSFQAAMPGTPRMDAVMYCLDALERFAEMSLAEVQQIGYEIAVLGARGLDVNDATRKYTLRSLPGEFSGLQLVALMYVAFQQIAPGEDIGFDLANEYRMALMLHDKPTDENQT